MDEGQGKAPHGLLLTEIALIAGALISVVGTTLLLVWGWNPYLAIAIAIVTVTVSVAYLTPRGPCE